MRVKTGGGLSVLRKFTDRLPRLSSPIGRRLASGGFWSLAGELGSRAFVFLSAIVVARNMGVDSYGSFAFVQSTLGMLMVFAAFGMGQTSMRHIAAWRHSDPDRINNLVALTLWFAIICGMIASIALLATAHLVATSVLKSPSLVTPLLIAAPQLIFCAVSSTMTGTVQGFEAFRPLARVAWISSVINFGAVTIGVLVHGLLGAVVGHAVSEIVRCLLLVNLASKVMHMHGFRLFARARLADLGVLWKFSLPVLLGALLHAPILWICQTLIAQRASGMMEVGLFDVAQKWMTVVTLVPVAAAAAFGPVLANLGGSDNQDLLKKTTTNLAIAQCAVTIVPAFIVAIAAPWLVQFFGSEFKQATPVLLLTMALAPIVVLRHVYWQALIGAGQAWAAFWIATLWAVAAAFFTWNWQQEGAVGLAKAMLAAHVAALGANMVLVRRIRLR